MIEIIVAIILQITILGGGNTEQEKAEKQEKAKTEKTTKGTGTSEGDADGGSGSWEG